MLTRLKNLNIRWTLVYYDYFFFFIIITIFYLFYRGGGILDTSGLIAHTVIAFACSFTSRMLAKSYQQIWRYGGVQCYLNMIFADGVACFVYFIIDHTGLVPVLATARVISVFSLNLLLDLTMRMIYRLAYKFGNSYTRRGRFLNFLLKIFAGSDIMDQRNEGERKRKIAIVGAGRTGASLAEELITNNNAYYTPVCFIDISHKKIGRQIQGIPVISARTATKEHLKEFDVEDVILALPNKSEDKRKELFEHYKGMSLNVKIYDYPTMKNGGSKRQIRNFEVEEVLFRNQIEVTDQTTSDYYKDKVILVTGGGGSIGSELSRQVADMKPKKLILLDIYENGVYDVQQELKMKYRDALDLTVEICSITNKKALEKVFAAYHPDIVINAAAHKHVPLMEHNCIEAIENNIFGTLNVVELVEQYRAKRYMQLSTDKAVNPTNVMGATKRMCEFIMQAYSTVGNARYSATRFGNVLGSAGSVIPLFKRQIAQGGPVTVTDKRIIRYFMTIPEASQLVLQSGAMAKNGELFVLDMGDPVKILELAENMIRLSGFRPYQDIDIIETGLRPGEKLYEELLVKIGDLDKTDNNLIFVEREKAISIDELQVKLDQLRAACQTGDDEAAREVLRSVVPTFKRPQDVNKDFKES